MEKTKRLFILHISILIFSFTGIFSKLTANSIGQNGIFSIYTYMFAALILINCGIYAIFWQQNLKHFDVNIAYAHRSVYNIWSLLWSVLIFSEKISIGNILGTLLIIAGIWLMQSE